MCEVLQVSKSGYYRWLPLRQSLKERQGRLNRAVLESWTESRKMYGSRRIMKDIKAESGICVSRNTVSSVMRDLSVKSLYQKKKFRKPYKRGELSSYPSNVLNRRFKPERADQAWGSDTTFIRSREGWVHLCVIMDFFSRKVVGWALNKKNNADLVRSALRDALNRRSCPRGVIFHSDRGSEYSNFCIQKILRDNQFISSMSRKGNCWDNAPVESFFKTLKAEMTNKPCLGRLGLEEIRRECFDYIEGFYNTRRIHSFLDNKSPEKYEK